MKPHLKEALTLSSLLIYFLKKFDEFPVYISSVCQKVESKIFIEKEFVKKGSRSTIKTSFSRLILFFCYCHSYSTLQTFLAQETASKMILGRINLINT